VRLADRDPKRTDSAKSRLSATGRDLFDLTLGDEQLGEVTDSMEV
jgi:hypothetical protein